MPDPFGSHNNLLGQTSRGTQVCSSPALRSFNSQVITPSDNHGVVEINLALNSATNFPNQNQASSMSSQLCFHQNCTEIGLIRSNHCFPGSMHVNNTSHSHFIQPQNTLNINIFMANNSPININLFRNNLSSQFVRNIPLASSSSYTPGRNNVGHCPSSNFQQIFTNNVMEINENPQFTTPYAQVSSPRVITVNESPFYTSVQSRDQEIDVAGSSLRQHAVNLSAFRRQSSLLGGRSIHCQDRTFSRSTSNLRLLRLSSRYYPDDNHNDFSTFPGSAMNTTEEQSLNFKEITNKSSEHEVNPQQNLQTPYNQHESEHSNLQALPQVPYQNGITIDPRRSPAQANSHGPKKQLHLQPGRHRRSPMRCRSHPYIKYGPYTCPKCQVTFQSANRYAAHVQKHYKDESPDERKKRREGKFTIRDLHIAESTAGITVMPGFLPSEETSAVVSNTIGRSNSGQSQGEGSSQVKIKKEIETDAIN